MGRIINFIYGGVLVWLAADSYFGFLIPFTIIPFVVLLMGILILFTTVERPAPAVGVPGAPAPQGERSFFRWCRRWFFGLVLIGISLLGFIGDFLPWLILGSLGASIIIALIGAIYFLSAFERTRNFAIQTR